MNIFVDTNRLGIFPLQCFVANNVSVFKDAIIECIYTAIDTGENYWLDYLLTLLSLQYSFDMDTIRQMTALDENSQKVLDKILSQIK